jgi:UDP-N-acetyl-D-glucosamine dehydrogenase
MVRVGILGQGYVGLPLAIEAAKVGFQVFGYDKNSNLISDLMMGKTNLPDLNSNEIKDLIKQHIYIPSSNPTVLSHCEIIVICVPTPLDLNNNPDLSYLEEAVQIIIKYVKNDALIINESTSYPGTLRDFIKPKLEKSSRFSFTFAAAPERIDPANSDWSITNTPRVISGLTESATESASKFYTKFCKSVILASSPEVAEASKLFENTFRLVNISLMNELSEITNALGFSAVEVIKAAATKPFGFVPFFPSIGIGGHCIPIDPTYLSFVAEKIGYRSEFITLANKINSSRPKTIAKSIQSIMGGDLSDKKIQIAGIAYKQNVSDMRESPTPILIKELKKLGAKSISWCDPLVKFYNGEQSVPLNSKIDLGLIISPHNEIDFTIWKNSETRVLDLSVGNRNFGWPKFF